MSYSLKDYIFINKQNIECLIFYLKISSIIDTIYFYKTLVVFFDAFVTSAPSLPPEKFRKP